MAVTTLPHLPMEILSMIHEELDMTDLKSLSMVNKRLRAITEPRLFKNLKVSWDRKTMPQAISLLDSLLDKPQLSDYIQHLRLCTWPLVNPHQVPLPKTILDKATKAVLATRMPDTSLWLKQLRAGTIDSVATLILVLLPNIKSLNQDSPFNLRNELLGKMLTHALCGPLAGNYQLPRFHQLQKVTFGCKYNTSTQWPIPWDVYETDESITTNNADFVLPFFYLPSLEEVNISMDNPIEFNWPADTPPNSTVTSLILTRLREPHLKPLLSGTPNLKSLSWNWLYQEWMDQNVMTRDVDLDALAIAFSQVGNTLTDLTLTIEDREAEERNSHEDYSVQITGWLSTLPLMSKLTRVCIPWVFVMGMEYSRRRESLLWQQLPECLEVLNMIADLEWDVEFEWTSNEAINVMKFELQKRRDHSFLQKLRSIKLPVPFCESGWVRGTQKSFASLSTRFGVEVEGRCKSEKYYYE
ncbi:hypothetical protein CDD81_7722 [Ophiocordyceps australis]|uniref:F-box domain-containing protein n=1 Tax=Ophiocordyceps australis TaxID=1399860 RepID=A0A2C5XZQ3_9HYPO|nr:hypothetical protein CDD81_7722 [Ophiocordyceps australis]